MAIKANLIIDQGTDYQTDITLTDLDDNVVNLSGYTANAQIRKSYTSSNAVSFSVTLGENTGIVTLSLTDTQTANITPGRYLYDVLLTSNNITSRIVEGVVTVTPGVTR
jgi:hypothetical protein